MQKNYIQFLVLVLVAIGIIMIAGIRNDVNSLRGQVASSLGSKVAVPLNGADAVSPTIKTQDVLTPKAEVSTSLKVWTVAEIEANANKYGLVKKVDGTFSSESNTYVICPTCIVGGSCARNGATAQPATTCSGTSCGTSTIGGLCTVALSDGSTDGKVTTNTNTALGVPPASPTKTSDPVTPPMSAEKKSCVRGETCQQYQGCYSGVCEPCHANDPKCGVWRSELKQIGQNLRRGMTNNAEVTLMQKVLVHEGLLKATPSGNFLGMTEAAVKAFQLKYHISPASGLAGPLTRTKLNELIRTYEIQ